MLRYALLLVGALVSQWYHLKNYFGNNLNLNDLNTYLNEVSNYLFISQGE